MNILLFGATGHLGSRILVEALGRGHFVTAFLRDPDKLQTRHARLDLTQGDARDAQAVARAVSGHEAVVNALGPNGIQNPPDIISLGTRTIVDGMAHEGLTRLISVAAAGILRLEANPQTHRLRRDAPDFPPFLRAISAEHLAAWQLLETTKLAWTLICPPNMRPGQRTGQYRVLKDAFPEGGQQISFEDAAHFVIEELDQGSFTRHRVGIAY